MNGGCFIVNDFFRSIDNLRIINNNAEKYALDCYHLTNSASITNLYISGTNGIKIAYSWYFNIENILISLEDGDDVSGIGMLILGQTNGGVNAITFKNVYLLNGLHNLVFDRVEGGTALSENLLFSGCSFEGSAGCAIVVNDANCIANVVLDTCYFEHCDKYQVDTVALISREDTASNYNKMVVRDAVVRCPEAGNNIPLFGSSVIVEGGKIADNGHNPFVTGAKYNNLTGMINTRSQITRRFIDNNIPELTTYPAEKMSVLGHIFNRDYLNYALELNTAKSFNINFNGNTPNCGFLELGMFFVNSDSYWFNNLIARIKYCFVTGHRIAEVSIVDKFETETDIFNNLTLSASIDVSDTNNRKIVLTVTASNSHIVSNNNRMVLLGGAEYVSMNGDSITITEATA